MDTPVAKLDITPTFGGFSSPEVECNIPKVHLISEKGRIYQINLSKKEGEPFKYLKYRDITQLGRYFSITLNDKTTRLYTTVNFLVEENKKFLENHLKISNNLIEQPESDNTQNGIIKNKSLSPMES